MPPADEVLRPHCTKLLESLGFANIDAPAALLSGPYSKLTGSSLMQQCLVEQRYVRGAQLRTLVYNQVRWRCYSYSYRNCDVTLVVVSVIDGEWE
jgi:hypothetical protein